MSAAPVERDLGAVAAFSEQVARLTERAGMVRVTVDGVAPHLDLVDGSDLQARVEQVGVIVKDTADVIGVRLSEIWTASDQAQSEAADLGLEIIPIAHVTDRREWMHHRIGHDYIARRLAQREEQQLPAPTPFEVVDMVLEACLPSYWRKDVLAAVGMDRAAYSKGRDERPRGHARKVADTAAVES